jgi:hypothetical protein
MSQVVVELMVTSIIGLREVVLHMKQPDGTTQNAHGCEVLTTGGYEGLVVAGTRDQVREHIRKQMRPGLIVPGMRVDRVILGDA